MDFQKKTENNTCLLLSAPRKSKGAKINGSRRSVNLVSDLPRRRRPAGVDADKKYLFGDVHATADPDGRAPGSNQTSQRGNAAPNAAMYVVVHAAGLCVIGFL